VEKIVGKQTVLLMAKNRKSPGQPEMPWRRSIKTTCEGFEKK
jgi:hypothetical protein